MKKITSNAMKTIEEFKNNAKKELEDILKDSQEWEVMNIDLAIAFRGFTENGLPIGRSYNSQSALHIEEE